MTPLRPGPTLSARDGDQSRPFPDRGRPDSRREAWGYVPTAHVRDHVPSRAQRRKVRTLVLDSTLTRGKGWEKR
jgi:hypothetical protein